MRDEYKDACPTCRNKGRLTPCPTCSNKTSDEEQIARLLCVADGGDPDTSLGGDKQNWMWHEYRRQAQGLMSNLDNAYALQILRSNFSEQE